MSAPESLRSRLGHVADRLAWGLADLRERLAQRGWWPTPSIRVAAVDGRAWIVEAGRSRAADLAIGAPQGLLVAQEHCLWGALDLPDMRRTALDAALQEAMWRVSPLPLDQIVTASRISPAASGGWRVDWGLCPRPLIDDALDRLGLARDVPICLQRDGEAFAVRGVRSRAAEVLRHRFDAIAVAAVLLLLGALLAAATMPLAFKRNAVGQSARHAATIEPQAAPVRQKLDALHLQAGLADALRDDARDALPLAGVLDQLASALPDDSWLDRLEISGDQIRITGLTGNAADLVARLARQSALAEVRTAAPTVRDEARGRERFSFEMRWRSTEPRP